MDHTKRKLLVAGLEMYDIFVMLVALSISLFTIEFYGTVNFSVRQFFQVKMELRNFVFLLIFILMWHLIFLSYGLYESRRLDEGRGEWKNIFQAVLIGTMVLLVEAVISQRSHIHREALLIFAVLSYLFSWGGRSVIRVNLGFVRRHNRNLRQVLFVGLNDRSNEFVNRLIAKPQLGYRIVGYIDDPHNVNGNRKRGFPLKQLGTLQDFDEVIDLGRIDEVIILLPIRSCYEKIARIVRAAELQGIQTHLLGDFFQLTLARARVSDLEGLPVLTMTTRRSFGWPLYMKRALDIIVALFLLLVLSPVFVVIASLIKLSSPKGPVFFVQTRVGYNRRHFKMSKFRSMVPKAERLQQELEHLNEAQGPVFKIGKDPRITALGRFLRKTSLDELPQLFNVLKGDMSLVGPRPLPLRDVKKFEEPWLKRRFSVKPGITCLWQVNGRSLSTFDTWISQDLEYIDNWSLGLDFKILAKTIPAVIRGVGAQ